MSALSSSLSKRVEKIEMDRDPLKSLTLVLPTLS
jgi:hypothetical protein